MHFYTKHNDLQRGRIHFNSRTTTYGRPPLLIQKKYSKKSLNRVTHQYVYLFDFFSLL